MVNLLTPIRDDLADVSLILVEATVIARQLFVASLVHILQAVCIFKEMVFAFSAV